MAESLFDIFGDHHTRQVVKNVTRQPLSNNENMGKIVSAGPFKSNEPMKKDGEPKKSFMSNTGKTLQSSTPARKVFTLRAVNVASLIYSDDHEQDFKMEEIEFTKPTYRHDDYKQLFEFLLPKSELGRYEVSPSTPSPKKRHSWELDSSYQDNFFQDDFSLDSLPDDDLGHPALY